MHSYNKGIVKLDFVNKKGIKKEVNFPMDKDYYRDICKLAINEQEKYLLDIYRFYCNEKYQDRKHSSRREYYINADFDYSNGEQLSVATQKNINSLSYNPEYENKVIVKYTVDEILKTLSESDRYIIVHTIMLSESNTLVAKELGVNESTVRRRKKQIIKKLKENFKNTPIYSNNFTYLGEE